MNMTARLDDIRTIKSLVLSFLNTLKCYTMKLRGSWKFGKFVKLESYVNNGIGGGGEV